MKISALEKGIGCMVRTLMMKGEMRILQWLSKCLAFICVVILWSCSNPEDNYFPPEGVLRVFPAVGDTSTCFILDLSDSFDPDDYNETISVSWDWNADGTIDSIHLGCDQIIKKIQTQGIFRIGCHLEDKKGNSCYLEDSITIQAVPITDYFVDPRDQEVYKIAKIDNNWWFAENLRYGDFIDKSVVQTDNEIVEKYAYDNDIKNIQRYGALYSWDEANNHSDQNEVQGICPPGWIVPSLQDYQELSRNYPYLYLSYYYGIDGPGLLNFGSGGYLLILQQMPGRKDLRNRFSDYVEEAYYWTSTSEKTQVTDFGGLSVFVESKYAAGINIPESAISIKQNNFNGFAIKYDWVHIYGNMDFYHNQANQPINQWHGYYLRCIKPVE